MGKSLLLNVANASSASYFTAPLGYLLNPQNTEALHSLVTQEAGTFSLLAVQANATGTSRVVVFRNNTADGNQTVSPTNTTAGVYADTTHSDTVSAGDVVNNKATATGSPTYDWSRWAFAATTNTVGFLGQTTNSGANAGTAHYMQGTGIFLSSASGGASEALNKLRIRAGGSAKNLNTYTTPNAGAAGLPFVSRLNGSNGNLTCTPTGNTAQRAEDTTHSDTLAAGDDYDFTITSSNVGGALNFLSWAVENSSATTVDLFGGPTGSGGVTRSASGTATYYHISGGIRNSTTESANTIQHGFAVTSSKLRILLSANTYSAAGTLKSRNNTADGTQTVSLTASTTGVFEDTTHSDSVASTDAYCFAIVNGTSGSITIYWLGGTEQEQSNDTNVAITGNAATGSPGSLAPSAASGLTGNSGTGGLGALAVAVSIALTGVSGTGSVGNLSPTASVALSGNEATGSPGSLTSSSVQSVAITGNTGTGSPGTLSPAASFALSGNQATGAVGSLTSSSVQSVALTGNAGTGAVGSLSVDASFALTGNAATGQVGSLTSSSVQSVALTGNAATGAVGDLTPSTAFSAALTGNAATGGVGSLTPSLSLALTGNSATGSPGTLVPSAGGSIALTGVSGTGAVGDLASSMVVSKAITGNAATGAVGSLGKTFSIALTGNAGTGSPGTLTPLTGTVVALTGVFGTGAVGDLGAYAAPVLRFIPQIQNLSQTQDQINAILAVIYGAMPGYGDALPAVTGQVDGRLFTLTTTNKLYQLQAGFWVALT